MKTWISRNGETRRIGATLTLSAMIVGVVCGVSYLKSLSPRQMLEVGSTAPPLVASLHDLRSTTGDTRKRVITFISADCLHCRNQLQNIASLQKEFSTRLAFIVVSLSEQKETNTLILSGRYPFRIFQRTTEPFEKDWKLAGVPALFLVDEHGIVRYQRLGEDKEENDRNLFARFCTNDFNGQ